jgi:PleD family two-component response regulator
VESMKLLVQRTDQALYAAKQAGRNRVQAAR